MAKTNRASSHGEITLFDRLKIDFHMKPLKYGDFTTQRLDSPDPAAVDDSFSRCTDGKQWPYLSEIQDGFIISPAIRIAYSFLSVTLC